MGNGYRELDARRACSTYERPKIGLATSTDAAVAEIANTSRKTASAATQDCRQVGLIKRIPGYRFYDFSQADNLRQRAAGGKRA
jgi:hypothetical protein